MHAGILAVTRIWNILYFFYFKTVMRTTAGPRLRWFYAGFLAVGGVGLFAGATVQVRLYTRYRPRVGAGAAVPAAAVCGSSVPAPRSAESYFPRDWRA